MSTIKILFTKEWKIAIKSSILPRFALMSVLMIFMFIFIVTRTPLTSALLSSFIISGLAPSAIIIPVILSPDVFVNEKRSRTILTLLAAPLSPLEIWISKALFLASLSFIFTTSISLVLFAISGQIPGALIFVLIFLIFPALEFSVSGLMGYLALGRLKPSTATALGMLLMMTIILSNVYIPRVFPSIGSGNPITYSLFYLALALILTPLSVLLVRKLDRESITAVI